MQKKETTELIAVQEKKDLKLVRELYSKIEGQNLIFSPTKFGDWVDLESSIYINGYYFKWNTEIKAMHGNFVNHLLKKEKLQRVLQRSEGVGAFYLVINAEINKAFVYDLKTINWNQIQIRPLYQYICESDHSKGKAWYDTYFIPRTLACKVFDLSDEQCKPFLK